MPPFSMDKPISPGSLSPEESPSNTPGSEREGEGPRGTKRKEKNKNAARKSRRKQTERADELHEELQHLECSNAALQKEITSLRRDLLRYQRALERHQPSCLLRDAASTSCPARSSPPHASTSTQATAHSTSLTPSQDLVYPDCVEILHLSSSSPAPTTTTEDSSASSSSEVLTPTTSVYSVPFSTFSTPHSLVGDDPPPSRPENVQRSLTDSLSTTAAPPQSGQGGVQHHSTSSEVVITAVEDFIMEQDLPLMISSNVVPPYTYLASGCPLDGSQLLSGHLSGDPVSPDGPHSHSSLQDPAPLSLSVSPQDIPQLSPDSVFASTPSYSQDVSHNPASLFSLLTSPHPLDEPRTSRGSSDGPPASPAPEGNFLRDLCFSLFLEKNDWILE